MSDATRRALYGKPSKVENTGPDFPPAKPVSQGATFNPGDPVIITTACEDIELHELTGVVKTTNEGTGSVYVLMDIDGSTMIMRPYEIGLMY